MLVEARAQARIRVEEVLHPTRVARDDDDQLVAMVFHHLEERLDGLLPEVVRAAAAQSVRLVNEEHAAERPRRCLFDLDGGLADVAGDQPGAVGLDQVAAAQHAERAVDLRDEARHRGLPRAGVAVKDQVARGRERLQALLLPKLLHLEEVDELAHVRLHALQADERVQLRQQLFERSRRGLLFLRRGCPNAGTRCTPLLDGARVRVVSRASVAGDGCAVGGRSRAFGVERLFELGERGGLGGRDGAVGLDDEVRELEERAARAVGEVCAVARVVGLQVGDADGRAVEPPEEVRRQVCRLAQGEGIGRRAQAEEAAHVLVVPLLLLVRGLAQVDEALGGEHQLVVEHRARVGRARAAPDRADAPFERRDQVVQSPRHARGQPLVVVVEQHSPSPLRAACLRRRAIIALATRAVAVECD